MTERHDTKGCLIYPENKHKEAWDLFMTVILLFTCISTPYNIAFIKKEDTPTVIIGAVIDFLFFIDIIIIFNSCYYNIDMVLVENRKKIVKNYLKGWFAVDFFAIVPFD